MRFIFAMTCTLLCSQSLWSQEPAIPTKKLVLHPAEASVPALAYHLLPQLSEMTPGNAAYYYQRAHSPDWWSAVRNDKDLKKIDEDDIDILNVPLDKFPQEKVRRILGNMKSVLKEIDVAARKENCDWGISEKLRTEGISLLIPDLQSTRVYARLLALRARLAMSEGRFDDAIHSLQTGLALGRHVGNKQPILIGSLVGIAITNEMLDQIHDLIQMPETPNIYWPLATLPRPFIDIRESVEGERITIDTIFPGIRQALQSHKIPTTSSLDGLLKDISVISIFHKDSIAAGAIFAYPSAVKFLRAKGYSQEQIDSMQIVQASFMYWVAEYDRHFDELAKWIGLPFWQAIDGLNKAEDDVRIDTHVAGINVALWLVPNMKSVFAAQARTDRWIAALQTLEALRMHAAHTGSLPNKLTDIKTVPIPVDPFTGKDFEYSLKDGKATLTAGIQPGREAWLINHSRRYEITLAPSDRKK